MPIGNLARDISSRLIERQRGGDDGDDDGKAVVKHDTFSPIVSSFCRLVSVEAQTRTSVTQRIGTDDS